jgi:hypothetical protein
MPELLYRTEDIRLEDIPRLFVETRQDRRIVDALKSSSPVVLVGSRGVGKSFLLRVAETELRSNFADLKTFPVYVSFNKSSLIHTSNAGQFQQWMLARLCTRLIRALRASGFLATPTSALSILTGGDATQGDAPTRVEAIASQFEDSWKTPGEAVDTTGLPTVEDVKDAVEELCEELHLRRVAFFIDEAAHIFRPEQQRQFFTLFRDLRSPYLSCNAAVYPGVTAFGDTFQPAHDATMLGVDRDVLSADYVHNMREIVEKQAESGLLTSILRSGENFAILAYAASGNPRILLKTVARAPKMNRDQINELIREYYRTDIWAEHSSLYEKYGGHKSLIDWGRQFVESDVLPELQRKNVGYLGSDRATSCFFWVHRDAPQPVREALRVLAYTGIVWEHGAGIKASRGEVGTRFAVNLGCLFALESVPTRAAFEIARNLTPKRMTEYGANHSWYQSLLADVPTFDEADMSAILDRQLQKPVAVLDITDWQKEQLGVLGLRTIGDVLRSTETKLREAKYVGEKRSRRMRNAAIAAVYEYLSG